MIFGCLPKDTEMEKQAAKATTIRVMYVVLYHTYKQLNLVLTPSFHPAILSI